MPGLTAPLTRAVRRVRNVEPFIVSAETVPDLKVRRDMPNTLGADLIVGAVAAKGAVQRPVHRDRYGHGHNADRPERRGRSLRRRHHSGVGTSLDALTSRAAQLSAVGLQAPPQVLGRNTMECIQSGMVFGTACMLDGLCDRIEEELGEKCAVIATGGLAGMVVAQCRREIRLSDTLLLDGLKLIWDRCGA